VAALGGEQHLVTHAELIDRPGIYRETWEFQHDIEEKEPA